MSVLFEPLKIGHLEMKNRFVRPATYFALADADGFIGDASVALMRQLANNDIGLIVTGYAYVLKSGQSFPDMNGIQDDDHIPGYRRMTRAVHDAGGKIVMQIVHCGLMSETTARTSGDYMAVSLTDRMPDYGRLPREMTEKDIREIIRAFGRAARRVQEAGFDGVQIHAAYTHLGSQFLSPATNRRKDQWGGSLENRMRFVIEVTREVKTQVTEDFPVMIKLGGRDYLEAEAGLTIQDGATVARALEKEGVALIEISHGIHDRKFQQKSTGVTSPGKEAYLLPDARVIRAYTTGPLCLVGGLRSLPVMEDIVGSGVVDGISICRPIIREPDLIKRWREVDTRPADCISCHGCFNRDEQGKMHIFCRQLKKETKAEG